MGVLQRDKRELWGGDGTYLDCGDGFTDVYNVKINDIKYVKFMSIILQ